MARKTAPVRVTRHDENVMELTRERFVAMQRLRQTEWRFDRHPTMKLADEMMIARDTICELERRIVEFSTVSRVNAATARADVILAATRQLGGDAA